MTAYDKIQILLIDDEPKGLEKQLLLGGEEFRVPGFIPEAGTRATIQNVGDLFDLRWLATAEEAREFRDSSRLLMAHDPGKLATGGWVPELLCFDYALTGNEQQIEERGLPDTVIDQLSPLPSLRRALLARGLPEPARSKVPLTGAAGGHDNLGLYCGGLILTLFADHPCAPVALTRKSPERTAGEEAGVFEWLLEHDAGETIRAKGRPGLSWNALLVEGVRTLRLRLQRLLVGRLVEIRLDDLLALATGESCEVIEVRSRFGKRRYPIAGLFADFPAQERDEEVRTWADQCLRIVLEPLLAGQEGEGKGRTIAAVGELRDGIRLANLLWESYDGSHLYERRARFSSLLARGQEGSLAAAEKEELAQLGDLFGLSAEDLAGALKKSRPNAKCTKNVHDLRVLSVSDRSRRWATLMVMVRLAAQAERARRLWGRLSQVHGLSEHFDPVTGSLSKEDVFLALFPVPSSPLVTPFESEGNVQTAWGNVLRRFKSSNGSEDLWLDVGDVLVGYDWGQPVPGSSRTAHGLHPGERFVLRMYSHQFGGPVEEWTQGGEWLLDRSPGVESSDIAPARAAVAVGEVADE